MYFNFQIFKGIKFQFDLIKRRLQQTNKYVGGQVIREKVRNPLFKADVILAIPNVSVKPTLDDMQSQLSKSIQIMLKMPQDIPEWNHSHKIREMQVKVESFLFLVGQFFYGKYFYRKLKSKLLMKVKIQRQQ